MKRRKPSIGSSRLKWGSVRGSKTQYGKPYKISGKARKNVLVWESLKPHKNPNESKF